MTRWWSVWRDKAPWSAGVIPACLLVIQPGLVAAPAIELQVVVVRMAETIAAPTGGSETAALVGGARVKVRDTTKRTGPNGAAVFALDRKAKVRVRVTAENFETESKSIDLTKSPLEDGVSCQENKCSVRIVLARRN